MSLDESPPINNDMPQHPFTILGLTCALITVFTTSSLPAEARYFGGYHCTDHCKGHAAGFQWARQRRIANPNDCTGGPSQSHIQGCRAYCRDRMRDATKDDDGRPID